MKRTLAATALLMIVGPGRADPPAANEGEFPNKTTVLLLDTLKIVEGDFGRDPGGDYTLRAGPGTKVFAQKSVLFAGESRVAVNQYLMSRAKSDATPVAPEVGLGDYNADALKTYPSRIQPIVGNLCASCHANAACPGGFKLAAIAPNYADPASAAANRRAVLGLIDRGDPSGSVLLKMMTTRHGAQREPAIPYAHHPALKRVELWAHWLGLPAGTPEPLLVPRRAARRPVAEPAARAPASAPVADSHDAAAFNKAMHGGR